MSQIKYLARGVLFIVTMWDYKKDNVNNPKMFELFSFSVGIFFKADIFKLQFQGKILEMDIYGFKSQLSEQVWWVFYFSK